MAAGAAGAGLGVALEPDPVGADPVETAGLKLEQGGVAGGAAVELCEGFGLCVDGGAVGEVRPVAFGDGEASGVFGVGLAGDGAGDDLDGDAYGLWLPVGWCGHSLGAFQVFVVGGGEFAVGNRAEAVRVRIEAEVPGQGVMLSLQQVEPAGVTDDAWWERVAVLAGELLRDALVHLLDRELVGEDVIESVQQRVAQPLVPEPVDVPPAEAELCDAGPQWGLVLQFDTDSPQFCRGFEVGQIWAATEGGFAWEGLIHAVNAEMVMRVAEARGLVFSGEYAGDGGEWMQVRVG